MWTRRETLVGGALTPVLNIFIRCAFDVLSGVPPSLPRWAWPALGILVSASMSLSAHAAGALTPDQMNRACGFTVIEAWLGGLQIRSDMARSDRSARKLFCDLILDNYDRGCVADLKRSDPKLRKQACDAAIEASSSGRERKSARPALYSVEDYFVGRGTAYNGLSQYNLAIDDLTRAINARKVLDTSNRLKTASTLTRAYEARALAYYSLGMPDAALADLDDEVRSNPTLNWFFVEQGKGPYGIVSRLKGYGVEWDNDLARNVLVDLKSVGRAWGANRDHYSDKNFDRAKSGLFGTNEMRGDIALAVRNYELAARYYQSYSGAFPTKAGLAEKIALAKKMLEAAKTGAPLPPPQPGSPSPLPPACKMYPNLC